MSTNTPSTPDTPKLSKSKNSEEPASPEEIAAIMEQLAQTAVDPNLTIVNHSCFDFCPLDVGEQKQKQDELDQQDESLEELKKVDTFAVDENELKYNAANVIKMLKAKVEEVEKLDNKVEVKPLKPCGKQKKEFSIAELKAHIKEQYLFTNALDLAKEYCKENKEEIEKQVNSMVALYNIGDKKAFYFISPQEARLAIDHVQQYRNGKVAATEIQDYMDEYIEKNIAVTNIDTGPMTYEYDVDKNKVVPVVNDQNDRNLNARLVEITERFSKEELKRKTRKGKKELSLSAKPYVYNFKYETTEGSLSVNLLNQLFTVVEQFNIMVDGIIVNAFKFAKIRSFGKTIYTELTTKEIKERKKEKTSALADLWTATIYRYNSFGENQITLYNNETNSFFNFTIVKKEAKHSCNILPLEKRMPLRNIKNDMLMYSPHVSTVQVMTENDYFCEAANPFTASVAGTDEKTEVYDVAVTSAFSDDKSKVEIYKEAFLSILRTKAYNDILVFDKLMLKLKENDKLTEEECNNAKITIEELIKTLQEQTAKLR